VTSLAVELARVRKADALTITQPSHPVIHYNQKHSREHRPPPNASIIELWQFVLDPDRDPEWTPADLDSDADRHQNIISSSLGHSTALHKISSKSVGNSIIQISDFRLLDADCDPDRHQN